MCLMQRRKTDAKLTESNKNHLRNLKFIIKFLNVCSFTSEKNLKSSQSKLVFTQLGVMRQIFAAINSFVAIFGLSRDP